LCWPTWRARTCSALCGWNQRLKHGRNSRLLCGYDADLRTDANRLTIRLRGLLGTYWPALERALDTRMDSPGVLALRQAYPTGAAIHTAGVEQLTAVLKRHKVGRAGALAKLAYRAAAVQTIVLTGSRTAAELIKELAARLATVVVRRATLEVQIEQAFFDLPDTKILLSPPGIGSRLGALVALEIGAITALAARLSWPPTLVSAQRRACRAPHAPPR